MEEKLNKIRLILQSPLSKQEEIYLYRKKMPDEVIGNFGLIVSLAQNAELDYVNDLLKKISKRGGVLGVAAQGVLNSVQYNFHDAIEIAIKKRSPELFNSTRMSFSLRNQYDIEYMKSIISKIPYELLGGVLTDILYNNKGELTKEINLNAVQKNRLATYLTEYIPEHTDIGRGDAMIILGLSVSQDDAKVVLALEEISKKGLYFKRWRDRWLFGKNATVTAKEALEKIKSRTKNNLK